MAPRKSSWKDVTPDDPSLLVGSGEGGFVSLEEIDENLVFGLETADHTEEVNASKKRKHPRKAKEASKKKTKGSKENAAVDDVPVRDAAEADDSGEATPEDISDWNELRLHPLLLKAIAEMGFKSPTPIQKACIPIAAHKGKDVIGAAETGSGKTLAFGIPILQRLLDERDKLVRLGQEYASEGPLRALIVTPTRELALQICDHLKSVSSYTGLRVSPIVGGISLQKQQRLLKQRPAVVVGTPGRLWELMSSGESHLLELQYLSFFVLDEADRMVEQGHFQELHCIIDMLPVAQKSKTVKDEEEVGSKKRRQTMVFSATLTLPPDFKKKLKKRAPTKPSKRQSVAVLSQKAGISENVAVVDLTSENVVAHKLTEAAIECPEDERDANLYYLLKVHGCGRTIVFCTSVAALRRVSAILRILGVSAWSLHAQMQQRQRLKTMDRFRANPNSALVATDVAARGLDIPDVRTVIHYQLPHSAEIYVHRSGRTARADKDGCSIVLVCPSENSKYISLCRALSKTSGLAAFPVDPALLPAIQRRVSLAIQIDKLSRQHSQAKAKKSWFQQHAEALEIDLDDNDDRGEGGEEVVASKKKDQSLKLKPLQEELQRLLKQPLETKDFSRRYVAGAGLTALAAKQLKEYVSTSKTGRTGGLVVIGQQGVEPLQALQQQN